MTLLARAYEWLWRHTTNEPYTWIMRRHPRIFAPVLLLVGLVGLFATFLAGHVFWGRRNP